MPYSDPEKQREANRAAQRRARVRKRTGMDKLAGRVVEQAVEGGELPEPPSRDFLMRALGVQAMEGNVPAIRLLLEEYRRDGDEDTKPAATLVDQLAARRAARAP